LQPGRDEPSLGEDAARDNARRQWLINSKNRGGEACRRLGGS